MSEYFPPTYKSTAFHCPMCGTYANQNWSTLINEHSQYTSAQSSRCARCHEYSYWVGEKLIYPVQVGVEMPNPDMPDDCREIFMEARSIVTASPKGAAALLRLCLQTLMPHLGESGRNINDDIGSLVKKGLPQRIQRAADVCRIVGNNAVHPGMIDLEDDSNLANSLFKMINIIVEDRISREKEIDALFDDMPEGAKDGIKKRDNL